MGLSSGGDCCRYLFGQKLHANRPLQHCFVAVDWARPDEHRSARSEAEKCRCNHNSGGGGGPFLWVHRWAPGVLHCSRKRGQFPQVSFTSLLFRTTSKRWAFREAVPCGRFPLLKQNISSFSPNTPRGASQNEKKDLNAASDCSMTTKGFVFRFFFSSLKCFAVLWSMKCDL